MVKCPTTSKKWWNLRHKYKDDYTGFILDICGRAPTPQQRSIIENFEVKNARLSVSSGHGTGKSDIIAGLIIAYVVLNKGARVVLVANNVKQVRAAVFKCIKERWAVVKQRFPWLGKMFILTDTSFYAAGVDNKGVWEVLIKGFRLGNEESLAGEHSRCLAYIIDEASSINSKAFDIMSGALTSSYDNKMILISQPTRNEGFFYDTHHALKKKFDGSEKDKHKWVALSLSAEDTLIVDVGWLLKQYVRYGSDRENPQYLIKVRGIFPDNLEGFMLTEKEMLAATHTKPKLYRDWGWIACCDVGNGRDSSVLSIFRVSGHGTDRRVIPFKVLEYGGGIEATVFRSHIRAECKQSSYAGIRIIIDGDGVGAPIARDLEDEGFDVQRIRWGKPMFSQSDKEDFFNQRSYATRMAADAVKQGRMRVDTHEKTIGQGAKIPYEINERGQVSVMKKKDMLSKHQIKSPDRWDTYCFAFLAHYNSNNSSIAKAANDRLLDSKRLLEA